MSVVENVTHANLCAILELVVHKFMPALPRKEQVLTKGVKWMWDHGTCEGHLLLIINIYYWKLYLMKNGCFMCNWT